MFFSVFSGHAEKMGPVFQIFDSSKRQVRPERPFFLFESGQRNPGVDLSSQLLQKGIVFNFNKQDPGVSFTFKKSGSLQIKPTSRERAPNGMQLVYYLLHLPGGGSTQKF